MRTEAPNSAACFLSGHGHLADTSFNEPVVRCAHASVAFFLELRSSAHSKFVTYLPNLPTYLQYFPACDRTTYLPTCIPSAPDLPSKPTYLPPVGCLLSEAHARAARTRALACGDAPPKMASCTTKLVAITAELEVFIHEVA